MNLPKDIQKDILSFVGHPIGELLKQIPSFQKHLLLQTLNKISNLPLLCPVNVRHDYQYIYLDYEKQHLKNMCDDEGIKSQQYFINHKTKNLNTIHDFEMEDEYEIEDVRHTLWKRHGMFIGKEWVRINYHRL